MALDADDEILQDFLVEAGEILEQLGEQLVQLEQRPTDTELLNAVFRGFHTIKGGAGFLSLEALVSVCHRAEDIFNLLRNGERQVTADLMDTMLQVLDILNLQFESLRKLAEPPHAEQALLDRLEALKSSGDIASVAASDQPVSSDSPDGLPIGMEAGAEGDDITDEEFEALLDALEHPGDDAPATVQTAAAAPPPDAPGGDDDITEQEFEALLDELHGKGRFSAQPVAPGADTGAVSAPKPAAGSDEITEQEFEALLDELHGKGKFVGRPNTEESPTVRSEPAPVKEPEMVAAKPNGVEKTPPAAGKGEAGHPSAQAEATVRVDTKRLDDIMNMVGELVLVRNRLLTLANSEHSAQSREQIGKAVANLDVVTGDLQMSVMKTRMQPIKKVFGRFPRVVRDLARTLGKEVNLVLQGEETDLDKNLVEALADPLVHLVRNAVDHGIEMPDERTAAGKPRTGTVRLAAEQEGDHILLTIEDDGAGMDPNRLRQVAVDKGLMDADAAGRLDDKDAFMLIFAPGFSTKSEISDISGRGVGMDVVKTRIAQLNGSIEIHSERGKGTRLGIKVPLTLAIMPTLMVKLRGQTFALPLVNVNEIFHLDLSKTNVVDEQLVVMIRGKALPLFYLSNWLVPRPGETGLPKFGHVVIVQNGTLQVGFVVDQLIGQEEVVIKPLGALLHGTEGMAGATITGDGKIALILDIPSLMKAYAGAGRG